MAEITVKEKSIKPVDRATIRFAGDSGDGIQLSGNQFTLTTASLGNDLATLPDFPAEIRAPAGTLPGVSSFQISFSQNEVLTPGDEPDVLVAMNPAALKANIGDLPAGKIVIVNMDSFDDLNLKQAGYTENPLENGGLKGYRVIQVPMSSVTAEALKETALSKKEVSRCKNFFALGVVYWLYDRPLAPTLEWIKAKFASKPQYIDANSTALRAGYNYALTTEIFTQHFAVRKAKLRPGTYRNVTGTEATVLGLIAASEVSGSPIFYGSYPITPASDILHELAKHKNFGAKTFQAEDEISAVGSAIGASYGGYLGITGTSGPGMALKSEFVGLAVMVELPLVMINVQRAGPSTGMPTKTEQADLLQAFGGRHGECPVAIVAAATPGDCFKMAYEAIRLATKYMTPVIFLSDGYLTNGSEPWRIPEIDSLPEIKISHDADPKGYRPYDRDPVTLARKWIIPGTPGLEHRVGGLETEDGTGNVCYDPINHETMVRTRQAKIQRIADDIPLLKIRGKPEADVLVLGWGSTYGAITTAVEHLQGEGKSVSSAHLRHLNPFPKNLGEVLKGFKTILVPELNLGQLRLMLRGSFNHDFIGLNKVQGQPFKVREIEDKINDLLR